MATGTEQNFFSGGRKKDYTFDKELLKSQLEDITIRYQKSQKNIHQLKMQIESKECLELIREVNKYTLIFYDLYQLILQLMIDYNQHEFDEIVDMINNRGKLNK